MSISEFITSPIGLLALTAVLYFVVGMLFFWIGQRKWREPRGCLYPIWAFFIPVYATIMLGFVLIFLLNTPFAIQRERRFVKRMTRAKRSLDREVIGKLETGTILFEQRSNVENRVWWTPDLVREISPEDIPTFDEMDYIMMKEWPPFLDWCYEKYTSQKTGSAFLIDLPSEGGRFGDITHLRSKLSLDSRIDIIPLVGRARKL